jgi:hypothetical protein
MQANKVPWHGLCREWEVDRIALTQDPSNVMVVLLEAMRSMLTDTKAMRETSTNEVMVKVRGKAGIPKTRDQRTRKKVTWSVGVDAVFIIVLATE